MRHWTDVLYRQVLMNDDDDDDDDEFLLELLDITTILLCTYHCIYTYSSYGPPGNGTLEE